MKISKLLWSILAVFATFALIAPQQVAAIVIDGRINGQIMFTGSGTITETGGTNSKGINSNGINSNGTNSSVIHELDFNGPIAPHGPLAVTGATGDFKPILGLQATFNIPIRWTGSGSSVTLLDVVPGVVAPTWTVLIPGDGFATGTLFSLKSATFDEDSFKLIATGTAQLVSGNPLVLQHSPARFIIQGTGQDFTYNNLTLATTPLPEGGSGLGLLAIGLVAVESVRRKIAARQNRYA